MCNPGKWAKFFVPQDKAFEITVHNCYKMKQNTKCLIKLHEKPNENEILCHQKSVLVKLCLLT